MSPDTVLVRLLIINIKGKSQMNIVTFRKAVALFILIIFVSVSSQVSAAANQSKLNEHISTEQITASFSKSVKIEITGMQYEDYKKTWDLDSINKVSNCVPFKYINLALDKHYRYSQLESIWKSLQYKNLTDISVLGKTSDNRKIYDIKIGNGQRTVLITAGVHARETSNTVFITKFIEELIYNYTADNTYQGVNIKQLLDNEITLHILPCVNPDGYEMTQFENAISLNGLPAKDFKFKYLTNAKSNARLVDINRSFPSYSGAILWQGMKASKSTSTKKGLENYGGKTLGSENETQAVMKFIHKNVNSNTKLFLDLHSGGALVYGGKPHLSKAFNNISESYRNIFIKNSGYKAASDETTGQSTDASITDYAAEYMSNFKFNKSLGRLIPQNGLNGLVKVANQEPLANAAVLCVETLPKALAKPADVKVQAKEWTRAKLPKTLISTISY